MPNIIALTSEYSPSRRRPFVTLMFCGFPLGAVLGGVVGTPLMQRFGWDAVFYMGGIFRCFLPRLCTCSFFNQFDICRRRVSASRLSIPCSRKSPQAPRSSFQSPSKTPKTASGTKPAFVSRLFGKSAEP